MGCVRRQVKAVPHTEPIFEHGLDGPASVVGPTVAGRTRAWPRSRRYMFRSTPVVKRSPIPAGGPDAQASTSNASPMPPSAPTRRYAQGGPDRWAG